MPKVLIDGVEYVPAVTVPALTQAIGQLIAIQYFDEKHKAIPQAWNVLNTLAPGWAEWVANDPSGAYAAWQRREANSASSTGTSA